MTMRLEQIVDLRAYPIGGGNGFSEDCAAMLESTGSLLLPGFITDTAISALKEEALERRGLAYYCEHTHTAYLSAPDPKFDADHPRNKQVVSSKGCITDDQIPRDSILRSLYTHEIFRGFLCTVLAVEALFEYADALSSITVHYYRKGQELGWHFDNSSFAVTLMIQPSDRGGEFEYIPRFRNTDAGDMNFNGVGKALRGEITAKRLQIEAGTLALFRGKNSLHRVTPVTGDIDRIQAVLAYNTEPGVALSEEARKTFYGRTD